MPRVSRFLFGDWLECTDLVFDPETPSVAAGYRDRWGASHKRTVLLREDGCTVTDTVGGFLRQALLRWRLAPLPDAWIHGSGAWRNAGFCVRAHANGAVVRLSMLEGLESRRYGDRSPIPVLEAEFQTPTTVTTELNW
jgi:hypothetical protein